MHAYFIFKNALLSECLTVCHAGPKAIAKVIHDVSGFTRWNDEASLAIDELNKTQTVMREISLNVEKLVGTCKHTISTHTKMPTRSHRINRDCLLKESASRICSDFLALQILHTTTVKFQAQLQISVVPLGMQDNKKCQALEFWELVTKSLQSQSNEFCWACLVAATPAWVS